MVSHSDAAKAGVPFLPPVWEVAQECYGWWYPTDPVPDLPIPKDWELQHRDLPENPPDVNFP